MSMTSGGRSTAHIAMVPTTASLRSATELLGDGDAMRARFREDGYLLFRGLLDTAPLDALRADILRTVAARGWTEEGSDPLEAIPSRPSRWHMGEGWRGGYIAIQKLESFHRQAFAPEALSMLASLYDIGVDDVLPHGQRIARVIWPEHTLTTPPHQDFTHIQGTPDFVTTWVPLSDCPQELGGLRLLVGSHTSGVRSMHLAAGAGGIGSDVDIDDPAWATTDWKLGDIVVFHSLVVHSGMPNRSGQLRLSCDYRYQSVHDPIAVSSLRPHNCPYVPDWPELLSDVEWETKRWAEHPDVVIGTFTMPDPKSLETWHESLPVPPSRFLQPA